MAERELSAADWTVVSVLYTTQSDTGAVTVTVWLRRREKTDLRCYSHVVPSADRVVSISQSWSSSTCPVISNGRPAASLLLKPSDDLQLKVTAALIPVRRQMLSGLK